MTVTLWSAATRVELNAALPGAVLVIPTGATEQHGDHLVTGHDSSMVGEIARRAAERASADVVLAPVLPFGSSDHHLPFGGTLSLSTETYLPVVKDLLRSAITVGARRVLLLNGHGGNHELNQLAARDMAIAMGADSGVVLAAASYWDVARPAIAADHRVAQMTLPGHAGQFETSTMLALDPGNVRPVAPVRETDPAAVQGIPGTRVEAADRWQGFDGFTDFPHLATAELGAVLIDLVVRSVAEALDALAR